MHYIRNVVVAKIVLENLKEVIRYVELTKLTHEILWEFVDKIIVHVPDNRKLR